MVAVDSSSSATTTTSGGTSSCVVGTAAAAAVADGSGIGIGGFQLQWYRREAQQLIST